MIKKEYVPLILWFLWIFTGTLWYSVYEGHPFAVALYQSTSVGWALGWSLPTETQRTYDGISLGYSAVHNSVGVMFTGLAVIYIAEKMTQSNENWMLQVSRKRNIKNKHLHQSGWGKITNIVIKWIKLNQDKVKVIIITLACILFGVLFGILFLQQTPGRAFDITLSTLTTCGYQGLPETASSWQYIVMAVYTNLAVPVFTISLGTLVSILIENPEEKDFYTKVAAPITEAELNFMTTFGIGNDTGFIDMKEYIILTIVRIGSIQPEVIVKIKDKYRSLLTALDDDGIGKLPYNKIIHDEIDVTTTMGHAMSSFKSKAWGLLVRLFNLSPNHLSYLDEEDSDSEEDAVAPAPVDVASSPKNPQIPKRNKAIRHTILRALGKTASSSHLVVSAPSAVGGSEGVIGGRSRGGLAPSPIKPSRNSRSGGNNELGTSMQNMQLHSRASHRRVSKAHAYSKNVARNRKQSIILGDRRPRKQSTRLSSTPEHPSELSKEQKLSLINRKYNSSKILPVGDCSQHGVEMVNQSPPRPPRVPQIHPLDQKSSIGSIPISDEVQSFDNTLPESNVHVPVRVFKNVSISEMLRGSGNFLGSSDEDIDDNDDDDEIAPLEFNFSNTICQQQSLAAPSEQNVSPHSLRKSSSHASLNSNSTRSISSIAFEDGGVNGSPVNMKTLSVPERLQLGERTEDGNFEAGGNGGSDGESLDTMDVSTPPPALSKGALASFGTSFKNSVQGLGFGTSQRKNNRHHLRLTTIQRLDRINKAHHTILKKQYSLDLLKSNFLMGIVYFVGHHIKEDHKVQAFLVWIVWMTLAACFYTIKMRISFFKGFFISTNVGYAVYWDTFDSDPIEKTFSVCHLITGQLFFSFALAVFARMLIGNKANWYMEAMQLRDLKAKRLDQSFMKNLLDDMKYHIQRVKVAIIFMMFLFFGVAWSCWSVGWSFENGIYFAITCMSTGGIWSLPEDVSDSQLFIAAIFTCTGAPIMMITFGTLAQVVNSLSSDNALTQELARPITYLELEFMQFEVIEDTDGYIDASEYILLMLVRLKALNPELISTIIQRFSILDVEEIGEISYADVTAEVDHSLLEGDDSDDDSEVCRDDRNNTFSMIRS